MVSKATLIILVCIIGVLSVASIYLLTSGDNPNQPLHSLPQEKIAISKAYTNGTSNAVFVDLEVIDAYVSIKIDYALIKDSIGNIVATDNLNVNLSKGELATIKVSYNSTFSFGDYIVMLVTNAGNTFVSPSFSMGNN